MSPFWSSSFGSPAPTETDQPYTTIAFLGCTHMTNTAGAVTRNAAGRDTILWLPRVDRIFMMGDTINSGTLPMYSLTDDATFSWDAVYGGGTASLASLKAKLYPVAGNHDVESGWTPYETWLKTTAASPDGVSAPHYYADNVGAWRVYHLSAQSGGPGQITNTEDTSVTSAQYLWLVADLAANPNKPILATMHVQRYSAITQMPDATTGGNTTYGVVHLWDALIAANADLVLSSHAHGYARWPLMDNSGNVNSSGIRLIGMSNPGVFDFDHDVTIPVQPEFWSYGGSTVEQHGILELRLFEDHYKWMFWRDTDRTGAPGGLYANATPTDSGTQYTHIGR